MSFSLVVPFRSADTTPGPALSVYVQQGAVALLQEVCCLRSWLRTSGMSHGMLLEGKSDPRRVRYCYGWSCRVKQSSVGLGVTVVLSTPSLRRLVGCVKCKSVGGQLCVNILLGLHMHVVAVVRQLLLNFSVIEHVD